VTTDLKKTAIVKALSFLRAAGAKFKVIEEDGTEHGELVATVKPEKVSNRTGLPVRRVQNRGLMAAIYIPVIDGMTAGEERVVPYGPFKTTKEHASLHSSLYSWCVNHWGKDSVICARQLDGVHVLRVTDEGSGLNPKDLL
jgi:hypothetical protein